jgi:hypothetical protein
MSRFGQVEMSQSRPPELRGDSGTAATIPMSMREIDWVKTVQAMVNRMDRQADLQDLRSAQQQPFTKPRLWPVRVGRRPSSNQLSPNMNDSST